MSFEGVCIRSYLGVSYSRGLISVHNSKVEAFSENDVNKLKQVAEIFFDRPSDLKALEKQTVYLAEFEMEFRSPMENATDVIINVNHSDTIQFINSAVLCRTCDETIRSSFIRPCRTPTPRIDRALSTTRI